MYIPRRLEKNLQSAIKKFASLTLTGPRQSGKSTLLTHLFKNYQYISFDDITTSNKAHQDINLFLSTLGNQVIFDEIQYFPEITRHIKTKIDRNRNKSGQYIFTGSSQFTLIKDLSETLAGRTAIFNLYPFDIIEYPHKKNLSFIDKFIKQCLTSSYPEPATKKLGREADLWFSSYLKTYVEKDVRTVFDIGNLREFQRFIQLLAARIAQTLNLSDISKELGISVKTLSRWLSVLEASFIIVLIAPYHKNLGKRITKHPKIYFLDCGLAAHLVGISNKTQLLKSPFSAQLFENFCVQEIIKYINHSTVKKPNIYFFRTNYGLEVDLIIEKGRNSIIPLEIKFSKTPNKNMCKNIELFMKSSTNITISSPSVLCCVDQKELLTKTIQALNLEEFLQTAKVI